MQSRQLTTQIGGIKLAVNLLKSDPAIQFQMYENGAPISVYLTEEEARQLGAYLFMVADEHGNEVVRRGEQHDEMRLQA